MQTLRERGFPDAKELQGGFAAWQKAGYAATKPNQDPGSTPFVYQPELGLNIGDTAIEFWLKNLDGTQVSLFQLLAEKPVMLEFGSYSSPEFRRQVAATEALIAEYRDRVHFVVVYVMEAYPASPGRSSPFSHDTQGDPITQPQAYEQRVRLASLCVKDAGITAMVLVDEINNPIWQVYGPAPNLAYLISMDGKITEAQLWYDSSKMKSAIIDYLKSQ